MTAARRLAAILAADVVGYSRLMGEDEAGTARAVSEQRAIRTVRGRRLGALRRRPAQGRGSGGIGAVDEVLNSRR